MSDVIRKTKQHDWVKITVTPIDVLPDENGKPMAFDRMDDKMEIEAQSNFGCNRCHQPLEQAFNTNCEAE